jgi:hypothetical protein
MLDICDQCGSGVSKKLLHRSDGTAVFHRECVNGHKLHRTTGQEDRRTTDSYQSKSYVIVEPCDCKLIAAFAPANRKCSAESPDWCGYLLGITQ